MIIRIFDTAVEAHDVERAKELFRTDVQPVFEEFDGCDGITMHLGIDEHSADLVEVCTISRWASKEAIDAATATPAYENALTDLRKLFRENPIIRHYETID